MAESLDDRRTYDLGALVGYLRGETAGAFLRVAVAACQELAAADNAALSVLSGGEDIQFVEFSGFPAHVREAVLDTRTSPGAMLALRARAPVFVPEYQRSPLAHPALRAAGVQSVYHVPLTVGEQYTGVLSMGWQHPVVEPTGVRAQILHAIAEEIGHALHRQELLGQLQEAQVRDARREEIHRALLAVSGQLARSSPEAEIFAEVAKALGGCRGLRLAWIAAVRGDHLQVAAKAGPAVGLLHGLAAGSVADPRFGPAGPCAASGNPHVWTAGSGLAGDAAYLLRVLAAQAGRSAFSVPLRRASETFGVLTVHAEAEDYFHDIEMCSLLARLADNAALAVERRRALDAADRLARHDPLTGLNNQVALRADIGPMLARAERDHKCLTVLHLTLKDFAQANDVFGYEVGDALLRTVAERLSGAAGPDGLVARVGPAEFTIVVAGLEGPAECERFVENLRRQVEAPIDAPHGRLSPEVAIGVAGSDPAVRYSAEELLRRSHMANARALVGAHGVVHFSEAIAAGILEVQTLREEIARAIAEGELVLHYQPQVEMQSGRVVAYEALVRWAHPERGLMPPGSFLPAIEGHPLMRELGTWVLESALAQMAHWRRADQRPQVNVNVAAVQLANDDFAATVESALRKYPEVDPHCLVLEIVESAALDDLAATVRQMNAVRRLGVRWALDDFGTGFSSLTHLQRLPVDEVKMDQSFTRAALDDIASLSVLNGLAAAVLPLGRVLVAEGVEDVRQGSVLLDLGCRIGQGYAISPPLPAAELDAWRASWRPPVAWTRTAVNRRRWDYLLLLAGWQDEESRLVQDVLARRHAPRPADRCRLGAWCLGPGREQFAGLRLFEEIEALHRELHIAMERVWNLQDGDEEPAWGQAAQELTQCSASLFARMEELYRMMRDA